ncbi:hypothetical protein OF117_01310 [Geodermatophilus sp. YIM 151500]|uniref:SCO7613 C-terminal domain-containing membrane protein n=1 Tax=Geodermatophilus sp. YIM 151500 TaxID=2984531 RepID=UPI0021E490B5|nr:hypothetical protein [Geodermatophilus sp. YIM 151500]MCV2487987.1 hypothetical protein [Geodermatophilus sp. YIM 151500]
MGAAPPSTTVPPLPFRSRPPHVLLAVGAVLLVTAVSTLASAHGGPWARWVLFAAAVAVAGVSLGVARARLRGSAETLAASAAGLALAATAAGGPLLDGTPVTPLVMAGAFLALHLLAPAITTWPLASWAAVQVGVLRLLDRVPPAVHAEAYLGVALLGLGVALGARRSVARVALVTTAPWWLVGVPAGVVDVWTGTSGGRWATAALVVAAGVALVPARLRPALVPLLGPRRAAPLVAGIVSAAAVTGALAANGTWALVAAGWAGVAAASAADVLLRGRPRGVLLPAALAGGGTVTALCLVQLVQDRSWGALSLLLLLVALPPAAVSLLRPADRHATVPISVWCLSGSVLLALPADVLAPEPAGVCLAGIYAGALALGSGVAADVRRPTARAAALTGAAAIGLTAVTGERGTLLAVLLLQGAATLGWAVRTRRRTGTDVVTAPPGDPVATDISRGWEVGAAHLVAAGWTAAALLDLRLLEAWTLPLAAGLLVAAGPRLVRAASWPAWGPGLGVALAPSTAWAVLAPDGRRAVWVLALALLALLGGARKAVLAPLVLGAITPVVLVLGLAVPALPWPLAAALVAGLALLVVGTLREWRPVAGFRLRLAQLR